MNHEQEGFLWRNDIGRWEIKFPGGECHELTSGTVVEVLVGDQWVRTRIESSAGEYYSVVRGISLHLGMPARWPGGVK